MFGNAILPPLTFNSNEQQTGQGASVRAKQTPAAGLASVQRGMGVGVLTTPLLDGHNPRICEGKANPAGGQSTLTSSKACLKLRRHLICLMIKLVKAY